MSWDWRAAVDDARALARAAKNWEEQGKHISALIKRVLYNELRRILRRRPW